MVPRAFVIASLALFVAAGCGSHGASSSIPSQQNVAGVRPATGHPVSEYIKHVIVIVQENRSFENFFAGFPGANAPMYGCASGSGGSGAVALRARSSSSSGCPPGDTQVPLHPITWRATDLKHDWGSSIVGWDNGKMDGFWRFGPGTDAAYAYVQPDLIRPYMDMTNTYVLADEMFPTEFGGSFTAHLTLVAGTDNISNTLQHAEVDYPDAAPDDCDSPPGTVSSYIDGKRQRHPNQGPFPCFNQFNTMAQVLDQANVGWKYYATRLVDAGMWEPFEAIKYVRYGPDWHRNIVVPQTKILTDPGSNQLASVSWVMPSLPDSDHPGGGKAGHGPSWVASVVDAIGESPYWSTSAIIVLWDDWGGWYDNAKPPQLDFRGLGIRVPCLIISPYSRETSPSHPGYVSHTQYEFGSILRLIEETFNLPYIGPKDKGYTDQRAASLDDSFDFTQPPRPFVRIKPKYPMSLFLHEPPSNEPVDTE
jgi:phospholipase C